MLLKSKVKEKKTSMPKVKKQKASKDEHNLVFETEVPY
jgi:hypothetical protein